MSGAEVTFENTTNRTEITKWYVVTGAPVMESAVDGSRHMRKLCPTSARFVFVEGDCIGLFVNARAVRNDGTIGERVMQVPSIYTWNKQDWPSWLHDLYKIAHTDLRAEVLV